MGSYFSRPNNEEEDWTPSDAAPDNPDYYKECRTLLLDVGHNPSYKALLTGLEGEDARNMVDFLSIVRPFSNFILNTHTHTSHDMIRSLMSRVFLVTTGGFSSFRVFVTS